MGSPCTPAYYGNLCNKCTQLHKVPHHKSLNLECETCPHYSFKALRIAGIVTVYLCVFGLVAHQNYKENARRATGTSETDVQMDVYIRIATDFVQTFGILFQCRLTFAYNFQFNQFHKSIAFLDSLYREMINVDCFLAPNPTWVAHSVFIKALLNLFVPFSLIFLFLLIMTCVKCTCKRNSGDERLCSWMRKFAVVMTVIVMYNYYPNVLDSTIRLMQCQEIIRGQANMVVDPDIVCYEHTFNKWMLFFVLPTIVLYIFGLPILTTVVLFRNRHSLSRKDVLLKYGFLFRGLRKTRYFWEIVSMVRKAVLIIAITTLYQSPRLQVFIALLILIGNHDLIRKWQPYEKPTHAKLMYLSSITLVLTCLFLGLEQTVENNALNMVVQLSSLLFPFVFVLWWLRNFCKIAFPQFRKTLVKIKNCACTRRSTIY